MLPSETVKDTGKANGRPSQLSMPHAHDILRCCPCSFPVEPAFSCGVWDCWFCFAKFVRRHRKAARMEDSRTIEANNDSSMEELEGIESIMDGNEIDDMDMEIELAGI